MLKIKDEIDLKELEKFGFEKVEENYYKKYLGYGRRGQEYCWIVYDKILSINATEPDGDGCSCELDDTLYDLIQAGYVEKVKDNV